MASKQAAANLNPLQAGEIRPQKVYVAVTQAMLSEGNHLISEIKMTGLVAEKMALEHENSLRELARQFEAWIESHIDDDILVNLTGGTKLMALAAYQVFSGYGFRCFYQEFETGEIIWLDDEHRTNDHIAKMSLERYLKGYQFDIIKKQKLADIPQHHKSYALLLLEQLSKHYEKTSSLMSKLNAHAAKPALPVSDLKRIVFEQEEEAFLTHLSRETQVFELSGQGIKWHNEADRVLIAGGWLEVLCADLLRSENIRDIFMSVEIAKSTQRIHAKTYQEIDVMAMQQQKLLVVECKTVNWKNASDASQAIYKLSSLSDIGGLNTTAIFVSLYKLPDAAKTRAAEHAIRVIDGKDLLGLKSYLLKAH